MTNIKLNEFTSDELQWLFNTVRDKGKDESLPDNEVETAALWLTQLSQAIEERNAIEEVLLKEIQTEN